MQRTKPETSRSMNAVPYQPSTSLVSLPMLTRPSTTATVLAIPSSNPFGYHKRPRVNSKAAAIGSLFRTKIHAKRNSTSGDSFSPPLGPQESPEIGWGGGIEYPLVSPLFSDESLQQLMGTPPAEGQLSPLLPSSPANSASSSSRRSKLESVLHNSTQPFRRLRSGPTGKTLSFPPATGESAVSQEPANDEFVVVTTDMCPPASLVSSSVISGVAAADAQIAAKMAATSVDALAPRLPLPSLPGSGLRLRAQTQVSKSSEHLLLRRTGSNGYADSTESLVRITTPSLSASSSEASLPLGQSAGSASRPHLQRKLPAPLLTGIRPQHHLQLPTNSALGPSFKPPLPAVAGSARKVSACSFSSLEDQRRDAQIQSVQLENLSPYTVNRLNTTAAKASERRRRSSVHRPRRMRTGSTASTSTWGLSAASDATLLPDAASRPNHTRNISEQSRFTAEYDLNSDSQQSFDFQIQSAVSETFWQNEESPLASDLEDDDEDGLAALHESSGFPSSCSANFDFDSKGAISPRPRAHTTAILTRSAEEIRLDASEYARLSTDAAAVLEMLDPSSPLYGNSDTAVPLHMLTRSRSRLRRMSDVEPMSPFIPDHTDFDGSTLTQQSDWLLMNASNSDGEQSTQPQQRRRMRKRRVLPRTLFQTNKPKHALGADEYMYGNAKSTETLNTATGDDTNTKLPSKTQIADDRTVPTLTTKTKVKTKAKSKATTEAKPKPLVMTEDAVRMIKFQIIVRLPASIQLHVYAECIGALSLHCAGDSHCWESARITCFAMRLNACLRNTAGLRSLSLVNLGLTSVPKGAQAARGLRCLNLSHNWIAAVPAWIAELSQLEHIILRDNPLRTVAADMVEIRHRLTTLDLGTSNRWALLSRPMAATQKTAQERSEALLARLHATAAKRMAACLTASQYSLTQRQHEVSRERATRLLAHYANSIYSSLREPRSWGHSVALPFPSHT
ncbi:hypothetical protein LPJ73_003035 [Coemansia sp. RSA 2703]|nr:hypothetical protein LPJ73_003035 [Coemansia sp. RSA 2703]